MVVYGDFKKGRDANELDQIAKDLAELKGLTLEEFKAEMVRTGNNIMSQMMIADPFDAVACFKFQ
jgi:phosphoribosylaminoimidazole-succinocarboxamide synthase